MKKRFDIVTLSFAALLIASVLCFMSCGSPAPATKSDDDKPAKQIRIAPMIDYTVKEKYPHDITLFTEGFLFHNKQLFESTGSPQNLPQTRSLFGPLDLKTGKLDIKGELDRNTYFGEGIVFINNYMYQLTYTNQVGFIYDAKTFERRGQFNYANREGWGLTTDGKSIIMSDGTNMISYLDPGNFSVTKTISVTENGFALDYINELEYIKGFIYANVWMTNFVVKIDPSTGEVVGKLDLVDLYNECRKDTQTLSETNGIAYDSISDKILVTGKLWPRIYEIAFPH